jgi:hypothetical protein
MSFSDDEFNLYDYDDHTRGVYFDLGLLTAPSVRLMSFPDADTTLAGLSVAQSWSALQTFPDNAITIVGSATATKKLVFELDGATAAKTLTLASAHTDNRTVTFPDATTALAGLSVANIWLAGQTIPGVGVPAAYGLGANVSAANAYTFLIGQDEDTTDVYSFIFSGAPAAAGCVITFPNASSTIVDGYGINNCAYIRVGTTCKGQPNVSGMATGTLNASFMKRLTLTAQSAAISAANFTNTTPAGLYKVDYYLECTTADAAEADTVTFGITYTDTVGPTTQTSAALAVTATTTGTTAVKGTFLLKLVSGNVQYLSTVSGDGIGATAKYALTARITFLG